MSAIINLQTGTTAALGGTFSDVINIWQGLLKQIVIAPATSSTTYDFSVTDAFGNIVFYMANCTGRFNYITDIPSRANLTFSVTNASVDENFKFLFSFLESL